MAHPLKSDAADKHTAKLRKMTAHYGAASGPANNKYVSSELENGPQDVVNFGVEGDEAMTRADRARRKTRPANPIATYKKGGRVKERAEGGFLDDSMYRDKLRPTPRDRAPADGESIDRALKTFASGRCC
jgi:hypothetical protein